MHGFKQLIKSPAHVTCSTSTLIDHILQSFTKYLRLTLVSMLNSALRESLISFYQKYFSSINKFSFWKENWALGYHSMQFRTFPDISLFPKIISLKSFGNSYIPCLKVITAHHFTSNERKIW